MTLLWGALLAGAPIATLEMLTRSRWVARWADRGITSPPRGATARAATGVLLGTAASAWYQQIPAAAAFAAATWLAILAAGTDLASRKIPREACWATLLVTAPAAALTPPAGRLSALLALVLIAVITVLVAVLTRGGLGSGDVRLLIALSPLAAWTGLTAVLAGLLFAALVQIPARIWLRRRHPGDPGTPFGPALVVGLTVSIVLLGHPGTPCTDWALLLPCAR